MVWYSFWPQKQNLDGYSQNDMILQLLVLTEYA